MREKLKKYSVLALLLAAKSFVYLKNKIKEIHIPVAGRAAKLVVRSFLYALLWALAPLYRQYRRGKRILIQFLETEHSRFLKYFSNRYALHLFLLGITIITVVSNLTARQAGAENFGAGSLVSSFVGTDEELLFNEPALPPGLSAQEGKTEPDKINEPLAHTFLSYTGETVFQPYLPITEESVAPRQSIEEYIVQTGDTPAGIAVKFRLQLTTLLLA